MYFVFYKLYEPLYVEVKVFLQGPYVGSGLMSTNLTLPLTSPYPEDEITVSGIPGDITDWVLLQLRSETVGGSTFFSKSCFLRNDGQLIDPGDLSENIPLGITPGNNYIVIKHRNHLAIMSDDLVSLNGLISYDFTTGSDKYFGTTAGAIQFQGVWGMIAGDANGSSTINATDYLVVKPLVGSNGYFSGDCNMSGVVNATDYLEVKQNVSKSSQVP